MSDLVVGIGIALMFEGVLYALMPDRIRHLMAAVLVQAGGTLRAAGLVLALVGLGLVALVRL